MRASRFGPDLRHPTIVDRIRAHFKTSTDPRVRVWMDNNTWQNVWFRGCNLPSIQDATPRYGRPLPLGTVVPGAGLFVALGTSTCFGGEANVHQNSDLLVSD